ncbi:MAG: M20/M25/M40 family metallo-hydrolase [Steroidobacteraceae bacterium]
MFKHCWAALIGMAIGTSLSATADSADYNIAEGQALSLAQSAIAMRSVRGPGNQTHQVADLFAGALRQAGWKEQDVDVVPFEDTAYLIATWPGANPELGPIVISAHMDVVEADPADWERDPFTPVIEDGYLFGRGASDTKFDAALAVAALIELRRSGYRPQRGLVIAFSGDEETTMATSQVIAQRLSEARMVLNVDGASGTLDEATGEPAYWSLQGAEKTYVDFQLEVTNPGGHSSMPRDDNAITQLSLALARIGAHRFAPELNEITRAYFREASAFQSDPALAAAMRTFAEDPGDKEAIDLLRADPAMIGRIATTCVPTMVKGGHAENALPQRATAIVNCRIFPGRSIASVQAELEEVAAVPGVQFSNFTGDMSVEAPASPLDPDYLKAVENALAASWGRVPIVPAQSSGASDSMWYRALGVASYSASATFTKDSEDYSHGLNERIPLRNIAPGIRFYLSLFRELSSR